jgi:hypothetical protein
MQQTWVFICRAKERVEIFFSLLTYLQKKYLKEKKIDKNKKLVMNAGAAMHMDHLEQPRIVISLVKILKMKSAEALRPTQCIQLHRNAPQSEGRAFILVFFI